MFCNNDILKIYLKAKKREGRRRDGESKEEKMDWIKQAPYKLNVESQV